MEFLLKSRAVVLTFYGFTILPFVTAVARAIANDWFPAFDSALLYLRAADVFTQHHPLLGSWSSMSVSVGVDLNNPGPLYDDLIAPFAHLFNGGVGNAVGVATVNVAFIIGAACAARKIGGRTFELWVLVASCALAWMLGSELLIDMYQSHALIFPFMLGVVLLIGVLTRHSWAWPWLAFVTSLLIQTHITHFYIVAILGLFGLILLVVELPKNRIVNLVAALRTRTAKVTAVVMFGSWAQTIFEQLFDEGQGNLSRLIQAATKRSQTLGLGNAVKLTAQVFSVPPSWTRNGFKDISVGRVVELPQGPVVYMYGLPNKWVAVASVFVLIAVLVACWVGAMRSQHQVLKALSALSLAGVCGSILSLSRLIVGPVGFGSHHVRWMYVLAVMAHGTILWSAARFVRSRLPRQPNFSAALCGLAILSFSTFNVPYFPQPHGGGAFENVRPAIRRLFEKLPVLADYEPVLYQTNDIRLFEPYSSTIFVELQRLGIEFRLDREDILRQVGNSRRIDGTERIVISQLEGLDALDYDGPWCVLASASNVSAADEPGMLRRMNALVELVAATELDVSAVVTSPKFDDGDHQLAAKMAAGDPAATRRAVTVGHLSYWVEHGSVAGDPAVLDQIRTEGVIIAKWVASVIYLKVSEPAACNR